MTQDRIITERRESEAESVYETKRGRECVRQRQGFGTRMVTQRGCETRSAKEHAQSHSLALFDQQGVRGLSRRVLKVCAVAG